MCQENIVGKTYGETMNELELNIVDQVLAEKSPDNKAHALQQVLYKNIESVKTYDEFKKFVFGYIGYVRKITLNNNPTRQLFKEIKLIANHHELEKKQQIITYINMLEEDIFKDWENKYFGDKKSFNPGINGPIAEKTQHILDQKV